MCPKMISAKFGKQSVMEHIKNTHLNETKKCPDCKQIFKLTTYRQHRRNIHGGGRHNSLGKPVPEPTAAGYECPDCKKILTTRSSKYHSLSCMWYHSTPSWRTILDKNWSTELYYVSFFQIFPVESEFMVINDPLGEFEGQTVLGHHRSSPSACFGSNERFESSLITAETGRWAWP